jgi:Ankyrin repeats (3 copies)
MLCMPTAASSSSCEVLCGPRPGVAHAGNTALHWAAAKGHEAAACWLLQRGALANAPNAAGRTALHSAVANRAERLLPLLVLNGGADLLLRDADGQTPRDWAVETWGHDSTIVKDMDLHCKVSHVRKCAQRDADGLVDVASVPLRDMKALLVAAHWSAVGAMERSELEAACADVLRQFPEPRSGKVPARVMQQIRDAWRPGGAELRLLTLTPVHIRCIQHLHVSTLVKAGRPHFELSNY